MSGEKQRSHITPIRFNEVSKDDVSLSLDDVITRRGIPKVPKGYDRFLKPQRFFAPDYKDEPTTVLVRANAIFGEEGLEEVIPNNDATELLSILEDDEENPIEPTVKRVKLMKADDYVSEDEDEELKEIIFGPEEEAKKEMEEEDERATSRPTVKCVKLLKIDDYVSEDEDEELELKDKIFRPEEEDTKEMEKDDEDELATNPPTAKCVKLLKSEDYVSEEEDEELELKDKIFRPEEEDTKEMEKDDEDEQSTNPPTAKCVKLLKSDDYVSEDEDEELKDIIFGPEEEGKKETVNEDEEMEPEVDGGDVKLEEESKT